MQLFGVTLKAAKTPTGLGVELSWTSGFCPGGGGLVLGGKTSARGAIGTQNFNAGQCFGMKAHEPACIRRGGLVCDPEKAALPAVGALFDHDQAENVCVTTRKKPPQLK